VAVDLLLADAEDAVDGVVDGPLSSEQPLAQPVAAGPANVGENCPKLVVVTVLAPAPVSLPVAAAAPQKTPSRTTASDSNNAIRVRLTLMRIPHSPPSEPAPGAPLKMPYRRKRLPVRASA
jgi:hypothetical protein